MHPIEAMPAWFQGLVWPSFSVMDRPDNLHGFRDPGKNYRERHYRPDLTPLVEGDNLTAAFDQFVRERHPTPFQPLSAIAHFTEYGDDEVAYPDPGQVFNPRWVDEIPNRKEYRCFVNWGDPDDDSLDEKFLNFRRFTGIVRDIQFTLQAQLLHDTQGRVTLTSWEFNRLKDSTYTDKDGIVRQDTTMMSERHIVPISYYESIQRAGDRFDRRRYVKQFMRPFQVGNRT